jgi:hypothetical protein
MDRRTYFSTHSLRTVRTYRWLLFSVLHKEMAFLIYIVVSLNDSTVMCLLGKQRFFGENGEYCVSHWLHQVTAWVPEPKHRDEGRPPNSDINNLKARIRSLGSPFRIPGEQSVRIFRIFLS